MPTTLSLCKETLLELAHSLPLPQNSLYYKGQGKWGFHVGPWNPVRKLLGFENAHVHKCCQQMIETLKNLESKPVAFYTDVDQHEHQLQELTIYCQAAKALLKATKDCPKLQALRVKIQRLKTGLDYRCTEALGGKNPLCKADFLNCQNPLTEAQQQAYGHFLALKSLAQQWKIDEKRFKAEAKELTSQNIASLAETSRYPKFVKLLKKDACLRKDFFNWALRDDGGIKEFIQFPAQWEELKQAFITQRAVYVGKRALSMKKKALDPLNPSLGKHKLLRLPFLVENSEGLLHTKNISILDKTQEVTFKNQWTLTIEEVIRAFADKKQDLGNLEFYSKGIQNWSAHHLGYFNPASVDHPHETIDLTQPNWWQQLPLFDQPLTRQELCQRYGISRPLHNGQIVAIIRSTRQCPNLDVTNSHGFLEIGVPNAEGKYELYQLGKYAAYFPYGWWEKLWFLANTVLSVIRTDVNTIYNHRQHAAMAIPLSPENGMRLLENVKRHIIKGLSGNLYFQFFWENCTSWPQIIMQELIGDAFPNLFLTNLLEQPMPPPLKKIFDAIKMLPAHLREIAFRIIEFFLGAYRSLTIMHENGSKEKVSVATSGFRKTRMNYLPARLHEDILAGKYNPSEHNVNVWYGVRNFNA